MAAFVAISSRTCSSLPSYKPAFGGGRLVASMNVVALGGLPSRCIRGRPTAERIAQFWTADFLSKSALDTTAKYIQLETNKNKMHQKCPAPSKSPHAPARRAIDRTACVGVACNHQRRWHPASIRLTSSEAHKASIASIHRYIMIQGMRAHIIASERSSSPASAHHPSARPIARARAAQSQRRQLVSVRVLVSCPARQCAATWQRCSQ